VPVATAKQVEHYEFAVLGEERIATPRGERPTLHLRNRQPDGKEATEVWLGLDDARLPIKIRHIDRRGDIFDQIAVRIEFEETKEGTR
jgi:negative regulator of sigma E activity